VVADDEPGFGADVDNCGGVGGGAAGGGSSGAGGIRDSLSSPCHCFDQ